MACFSLAWIEQLLVWAVIIAAIIAILKIIVPWVLSKIGPLGEAVSILAAVIRIIVWAVVIIFVIYLVFALISCLISGGLHLPPLGGR